MWPKTARWRAVRWSDFRLLCDLQRVIDLEPRGIELCSRASCGRVRAGRPGGSSSAYRSGWLGPSYGMSAVGCPIEPEIADPANLAALAAPALDWLQLFGLPALNVSLQKADAFTFAEGDSQSGGFHGQACCSSACGQRPRRPLRSTTHPDGPVPSKR